MNRTPDAHPPKVKKSFPLFAHKGGQWAKKIAGKRYYFGSWRTDPTGELALAEWHQRDAGIRSGTDQLRADVATGDLTVLEMCKRVMKAKHDELLAGRLADETYRDYTAELQCLADLVGPYAKAAAMRPEHFAKAMVHLRDVRKLGTHRLATSIRYIRAAFNFAAKSGWIPAPIFGPVFRPPSTDPDAIAVEKGRKGGDTEDEPIYTPEQIAWMLANAPRQMRAIIMLMLNTGMGASDVAKLRWRNIQGERLTLRRGKNGIRREAYLWRRTRDALDDVKKLKHTKKALSTEGNDAHVFLTRHGLPYVRRTRVMDGGKLVKTKFANAIATNIGKLVRKAKAKGVIPEGKKLSAYNFRHSYRTAADNCVDLNAVLRTMGRKLYGQSDARYVRGPFKLRRLKTVALTVKKILLPAAAADSKPSP